MNKQKLITFILGIGVTTAVALYFINVSNDHIECQYSVENSIGENGEKVTTKRHVCKERYNF
jgi:uncharacterized membrane protein YgaE (UPF0421/DUF939 family)